MIMNEQAVMLNLLEERLPDGLEFATGEEKNFGSAVEIIFGFRGLERRLWMHVTDSPRIRKMECDRTIATAMQYFARKLGDTEMEVHWKREYERT